MDSVTTTLLAGAVNDVTLARNECERAGLIHATDALNRALTRLSVVEDRLDAPVTYRVRM